MTRSQTDRAYVGNSITQKRADEQTFVEPSEDGLKINFTKVFHTIEAAFTDDEIATYVGIRPVNPSLVTERIMYADKGGSVEKANTVCAAGRYNSRLCLKNDKRGPSYNWMCQF